MALSFCIFTLFYLSYTFFDRSFPLKKCKLMTRSWFRYRRNFSEILARKAKFVISQGLHTHVSGRIHEINYDVLITCNNHVKVRRQKVPRKKKGVKATVSVPDPFQRFYKMHFIYLCA